MRVSFRQGLGFGLGLALGLTLPPAMTCRTKAWASAESAGVVIFFRAATLSPGHVFAWTNHLLVAVTFRMHIVFEEFFQQSRH